MLMMKSHMRENVVVLIVVVLYFTVFSGSNGKNLAILQRYNNSSNISEYNDGHPKSKPKDIVGATNATININSQESRQQIGTKENLGINNETAIAESVSVPILSTVSPLLPFDYLTITVAKGLGRNDKQGSEIDASKEMLSITKDTTEVSRITPTTYRPVRPSFAPNNMTQERERKLMNVLAARRNVLHNARFRTRIGTTGRTVTVTSMETTSRTPTDPRSICIRNCTKNFTRRTTASCMRQCSNFSHNPSIAANTNAPNNSIVIVRPSSRTGLGTQISDGDNNEILFTDESSHGLFVVAKEQNDTLNHIPDVVKSEKFRPKNKSLSTATVAPSSIEDDDIQPYLYFGQKLPPIKPATLTITSISEEHPKLLEVSVSQKNSTIPTTSLSASALSAVERSRSRYKYRDRGYVNIRRSPTRAISLTSKNPIETKSEILISHTNNITSGKTNTSTNLSVLLGQNGMEGIKERNQMGSTQTPILSYPASTTPLIIKVFEEENKTTKSSPFKNDQPNQKLIGSKSLLARSTVNLTDSLYNYRSQNSTPPTSMINTTTSKSSTVKSVNPTSPRAALIPNLTKILITANVTTELIPIITPLMPTPPPTTTSQPRIIIHEDIEKLRALGPKLTKEIENDENFVTFLNHTDSRPFSTLNNNTTDIWSSTDVPVSNLSITLSTSGWSDENPHTESSFLTEGSTSNKPNMDNEPFHAGIIESTPIEQSKPHLLSSTSGTDIKSTYVTDESDVSQEMRRVNIATMVLAGIGIIPLCAIILYLVRSYLLRRNGKSEEVFDVCITDQQPISPVKKIDSKYRSKTEDEEDGTDHHTAYTSLQYPTHVLSMTECKIKSRDTNHNNRYDERCSVSSDQEFDRSNIRLKSLLGEGNFGQVWKAEADDLSGHFGATRIVAVKTVRKCSSQSGLKEEADIMRKLGSHRNVVTLLGACVESEPHMLIMEYAMRGRLLSLLRAARSATNILPASVPGGRSLTPLSPRTLGGFALDIACGMEYIAGKRIVHRDLAARNVLLDHNGVCKICDFGMSIDLDAEHKRMEANNNNTNEIIHSNTKKNKLDFGSRFIINHWHNNFNTANCSPNLTKNSSEKKSNMHGHLHGHDTIGRRPALPIRWMAPEALQYHIFTTETDVWAFGIVLWEIATLGSTPYANLTGREVIRRVPNGLRPELPKEGRYEFYNLMTVCWQKDPHLRPSFTYARQEISRSMQKWVDDDSNTSDYMDVSGFSEDLEHGMVYFNHRISEFECEI